MILNQWYAVVQSKKVKSKKPLSLKRFGENLVLWRDESGKVACLPDKCSHRGARLSPGKLRNSCIECPYHGLQFDSEGVCRFIPANGKDARVPKAFHMTPYPVREEHGLVWVWWGRKRRQYPSVPWFDYAPLENCPYSGEMTGIAPVHYARYIEGSLDIHHLAVLHGNLMPGIGTLLDPYEARQKGDLIESWGNLRKDDGKSFEESPGMRMKVCFRFPTWK